MSDQNELMNSEQAQKLMRNGAAMDRLKKAPETQRLMELLGKQAGGSLDRLAADAAKGDTSQLMGAIQKLLRDPESKELLGKLSQEIQTDR